MKENGIPRRGFVNWFLGTAVIGLFTSAVYPIFRFLSPPDRPEAETAEVEAGLTNDPDLLERGFKIIRFGSEPVILIRVDDQDFRAFNATCTHLDCVVEYQKKEQQIWCNCHNGGYDLMGRNVIGPPPKPLKSYTVNLVSRAPGQAETIVVSRS